MTLACLPNAGTAEAKFHCALHSGQPLVFWATAHSVFVLTSDLRLQAVLALPDSGETIQSVVYCTDATVLAVLCGETVFLFSGVGDSAAEWHDRGSFSSPRLRECSMSWEPRARRLITANQHLCMWDVAQVCRGECVIEPSLCFLLPVHAATVDVSPDGMYAAVTARDVLPILRILQIGFQQLAGDDIPDDPWPLQYHAVILDSPADRVQWKRNALNAPHERSNSLLVTSISGTHYVLTEMPRIGRNGSIDRFAVKYVHQASDMRGSMTWWQLGPDPTLFFNPLSQHDPFVWQLASFPGGVHSMTSIESSISICGLGRKVPKAARIGASVFPGGMDIVISDAASTMPALLVLRKSKRKDEAGSKDRFELVASLRAPTALHPAGLVHSCVSDAIVVLDSAGSNALCENRHGRVSQSWQHQLWEQVVPGKLDAPNAVVPIGGQFVALCGGLLRVVDPSSESVPVHRYSFRNDGPLVSCAQGAFLGDTQLSPIAVFVFQTRIAIIDGKAGARPMSIDMHSEAQTATTVIQHGALGAVVVCGTLDSGVLGARVVSICSDPQPSVSMSSARIPSTLTHMCMGLQGDIACSQSESPFLSIFVLSARVDDEIYEECPIAGLQSPPLALCWAMGSRRLYAAFSDRVAAYECVTSESGESVWYECSSKSWPANTFPNLSDNCRLDISVDRCGTVWVIFDACIYSIDPLQDHASWLVLRDNRSRMRRIERNEQINNMALGLPHCESVAGIEGPIPTSTLAYDSTESLSSRNEGLFSFFDVDPENVVASVSIKEESVILSTDDIPTPGESLVESPHSSLSSIDPETTSAPNIPSGVDSAGAMFIWYSRIRKWGDASELSFEGFELLAARMSDAQEVLINITTDESKCMLSFAQFERVGLGLWVSNMSRLRELLETVAKVDYSLDRDPRNCTLIYILLGRQVGLGMLWRQNAPRIATFLGSDFTQATVRSVAAKNAFAAQAKQDYRLSVIFFLLAGHYRDAIVVCLDKLHNLHLAALVIRFKLGHGDLTIEAVEDILGAYAHAIPMLVRVLIRKVCNDASDVMELYEQESATSTPSNTPLCIPLAMACLRRLPLPPKQVLSCVHMLCRHACYSTALRLAELYSDHVPVALRTLLKMQSLRRS